MLVAMVPLLTMAQKKSKKGKKNKIEKVDNSNATYEFMVISGFEIDKDASRSGTAEIPADIQIKKLIKSGSQVMINFDFGTRSQENSELMKNARSYRTMASAVTALANNGWEFVNANVVNLGTTKAHYYYMKRSK
jgi:2C-methyl-D-erythritol 2,4-cyclodiphosphate synthase